MSFAYQARRWRKPQRIVCKGAVSAQGPHIRLVVSKLHAPRPSLLYDMIYGDRGRMEHFIQHHQTFLHSDRPSCHTFAANALRLLLHSAAYVWLHALAEHRLRGTVWGKAQVNILQLRLRKVGAKVRALATKITVHVPTSFPLQGIYRQGERKHGLSVPSKGQDASSCASPSRAPCLPSRARESITIARVPTASNTCLLGGRRLRDYGLFTRLIRPL